MKLGTGYPVDNPAYPVLKGLVCFEGISTGPYPVNGAYSLVCDALANEPSYKGCVVKILSGPAAGQSRIIIAHGHGMGDIYWTPPLTDSAGNFVDVNPGVRFQILNPDGSGYPNYHSPAIGMFMMGVCRAGMTGSTTHIYVPGLGGFNWSQLQTRWYMQVLINDDSPGVAPEGEIRQITDYWQTCSDGPGRFTTNAFSANVEEDDIVAVFHEAVYNMMAISEIPVWGTPQTGTLTTTGGEDTVFEVTQSDPYRLWAYIFLDNMQAGDTFIFRVKVKDNTGAYQLKDEQEFSDAQTITVFEINGIYGDDTADIIVTIQRTAGIDRNFDWRYNVKKES